MNEKIYSIAVGRGRINSKVTTVMCNNEDIETVAMSLYRYVDNARLFGNNPIMCAYVEGDEFDWDDDNMIVLIDCM